MGGRKRWLRARVTVCDLLLEGVELRLQRVEHVLVVATFLLVVKLLTFKARFNFFLLVERGVGRLCKVLHIGGHDGDALGQSTHLLEEVGATATQLVNRVDSD